MVSRRLALPLLFLSWIGCTALGAFIAIHRAETRSSASLNLRSLQILGADGKPHIRLETRDNQPAMLLTSANGTDAIRLDATSSEPAIPGLPRVEIFDPEGNSAIQLFGFKGPRGLLAFSSQRRPEGKVMLGHFGLTDDGTDSGMWGLQVYGQPSQGFSRTRVLGVTTSSGHDQSFVWPLRPEEQHRKLKP